MMSAASRIFCSIDTTEIDAARRLAAQVNGAVGGIKLGLEFFSAQGRRKSARWWGKTARRCSWT